MAAVLLYWIYLLFLTISIGIGIIALLQSKHHNPLLLPFFGGFGIALFAGFWAIWGNLGASFEVTLAVIAVVIALVKRLGFKEFLFSLKAKLKNLPLFSKILLSILSIFALAQCASAPYVIDNESYYIQTIKWLDQYGYVPGLANFHFFLGQQSGWHILQSALNLDGISTVFNDINGFYLIIANVYALDKLNQYRKNNAVVFLAAGLFPIFNVFLFQFISAPSPDLPIYLITLILFTEFARYYIADQTNKTPILLLFILVIFAVFIKVIAIFLLAFPVMLYLKEKSLFKKDVWKLSVLSLLALLAFVVKNSIISGYPLYPLAYFKLDTDWTIPLALQQYLVDATKAYAFFITPEEYGQLSLFQRISHWVFLPKLHGLFNKGILVVLVVFPIIFRKQLKSVPFRVLYSITAIQLLFLWLSSPQYRFFLGYFIILSCLLLSQVFYRKKLTALLLALSTVLIAIPLFVPFNAQKLTKNAFVQDLSSFSLEYVLHPHPQTKYTAATYKKLTFGNLEYFTPTDIDFFWATGDCELPCIQKKQLIDFKNYFEQAPQLRSQDLGDGFKSVYFRYE